ncbi:MAG: DUF1559 domain-containing protein [Planctomycetia bacterium]|nr:DUF1559 domain-containing protein [Planctomycetia bacterium]
MEEVTRCIAAGYVNNVIFYRIAFSPMENAEVRAEYAQMYADLVAQNHADRPQFRDGFRLGAKEAVQVVFTMNPLIQGQLEPMLEEFTENGNLANPGARVIARGLDTVMVSLDLHCATAKVRACSKTEAAARNMVKVANKWKEQILRNVENSPVPQVAFITQIYLDMLKLTQDGKDLALEISVDEIVGENLIYKKRNSAVVAASVTGMSAALLLSAVQKARNAARRMQFTNNMKQLGLAALVFESVYRNYSSLFTVDDEDKPLHSWRVLLLPYLEQQELLDQIRLDEPWDSDWNS